MLQFSQREVEGELNDILKFGDDKKIATIVGVHDTYISQQCNPDHERKSWLYQTLQFICAEDDVDCGRGENVWQMMKRFRDLSKKKQPNAERLCVAKETGMLNAEVADVINCHLNGKSYYEQLKEVDEAEAQVRRTRQAIMEAIGHEREILTATCITNGNGRPFTN